MDEVRNQSAETSNNQLKNIRADDGNKTSSSRDLEKVQSPNNSADDLTSHGAATEEINGGEDEPQSVAKEASNNQTMGIP